MSFKQMVIDGAILPDKPTDEINALNKELRRLQIAGCLSEDEYFELDALVGEAMGSAVDSGLSAGYDACKRALLEILRPST